MLLPQDTFGLYDILEQDVAVPAGGAATQLCLLDPTRVVAFFSSGAVTSPVVVSTDPNLSSMNSGIPLGLTARGYLDLTHVLYGALVNQAWYAYSMAGCTVTVIQLFLRRRLSIPQQIADEKQP